MALLRFVGAISDRSAPVEEIRHRDLLTRQFPGGFLSHHSQIAAHNDDGEICVACGEPRFDVAEHREIARAQGPAAAWAAAFRRFGVAALERVRGRFSFVLLQPRNALAVLATDRFGSYPVCYGEADGSLFFAERANDVPGIGRALSLQSVFDYLYFHTIPAPATIFANVRRLHAGFVLKWQAGRAEVSPYWLPKFDEDARPNLADKKRQFVELVERAVQREANEQRIGAFLSGGTDSSTVAGMLCKISGGPARTYSIGFDAAGYDEMAYARIAARHFRTDHHEYYVTPEDLIERIPRAATHYDQPFGNSSAVPALVCAERAAAGGVRKLLAGDGGDELFGGNVRYATQKVFEWYHAAPRILRNPTVESAVLSLRRVPVARKAASYVSQARQPMPDRLQRYNLLSMIGMESIFEPSFLARIDPQHPSAIQRDVWQAVKARSLINRMLAFDWKFTLADSDLPKVIGTTELAGVDVGFPLLDEELVEFSMSLPPAWKLKRLTLRWFFKEALKDFLPIEIIQKKKHGFGLPFGTWTIAHAGLGALAQDALRGFAARGVVQASFLKRLWDELLPAHPGYYGEMVWILMILELWLRASAPDWTAES